MAAWGITSICEALNMNVIPISLSIDGDAGVYDMAKRSFAWPLKKDVIKQIILGKLSYDSELKKLRRYLSPQNL